MLRKLPLGSRPGWGHAARKKTSAKIVSFIAAFTLTSLFFDYFYKGPPEVPMGLRASCHGHAVMLRVCARQVRAALPQNTTKPAPGPQGTCSTARNLTQMGFERLKMSQLIPPSSCLAQGISVPLGISGWGALQLHGPGAELTEKRPPPSPRSAFPPI